MTHPVDLHVGARIRQRRLLAGLTQQSLAERLGVAAQQIQKYESAGNRISAGRLWDLAHAMGVPVAFFYEGLGCEPERRNYPEPSISQDAAEFVRNCNAIPANQRRHILSLAQTLAD